MFVLNWFHRANTKYMVNVLGVFEGGMSMPLAGEEKTTLSDAPEAPLEIPGNISLPNPSFNILSDF